jgi:ABC-type uncharacterized transport system auxiliary subunit
MNKKIFLTLTSLSLLAACHPTAPINDTVPTEESHSMDEDGESMMMDGAMHVEGGVGGAGSAQ